MVKEIKLNRGLVALVDDEDYERVIKYNWYALKQRCGGYYAVTHDPINHNDLILMHRFILNAKKGEEIDHINGQKLNCCKHNLRIVTRQQNQMNRKKQLKPSCSKYKGVSWKKSTNKWSSAIGINGRMIHLGYFFNEEDAARTYDNAVKKYFGEYGKPNFPAAES